MNFKTAHRFKLGHAACYAETAISLISVTTRLATDHVQLLLGAQSQIVL